MIDRLATTSLRLNSTHIDFFKRQGWSLSRFVRRCMSDAALREGDEAVMEFRLDELENAIVVGKSEEARQKKVTSNLSTEINDMEDEYARLKGQEIIIKKTNELSRITGAFNKSIMSYGFDVETIRINCVDMIKEIEKRNDRFVLEEHVKRMQEILG